jgi:type IV secretory pathway ATPase VirB11/archaellum biosynthesis ATPase
VVRSLIVDVYRPGASRLMTALVDRFNFANIPAMDSGHGDESTIR